MYPGDKVDAEVWTYYEANSGYGTGSPGVAALVTAIATGFGGASGGGGESGSIFDGVNSALGGFGLGGNAGDAAPAAYLNYILFDQQYKVLDMGWIRVPTSAYFSKQKINLAQVSVKEAGYIFVYLSYEDQSNNYVYFDDFKITQTKSNLIQGNEYYPFGMQTANSWTREAVTGNNYLANACPPKLQHGRGGTELNATTQLYDLEFRNYDPALGRMFQVDPVAAKYASLTPYNYSFNNPIAFADPSGADPDPDYQNPNHQYYFHNGAGSAGYPGLTYDDVVPQSARGEFNSAFGWRQDVMLGWFAGGGNMGAYWHPGDGRLFWSGYESGAREYRRDQDAVRYGDMSSEQFDEKYGGYRLSIDFSKLPENSQFTVFFKDGKISGFVYARWLGKAPEMNLTVKAKTLDRHDGGPTSPDFVSPISDAVVTDTWGSPRGDHTHDGVDISRRGGSYGLPIHSVSVGRIVKLTTQLDGGLGGIRVSVRDGNGYTHSYNHMIPGSNSHLVKGQLVNQGTILGSVGGSAGYNVNGVAPHLHYMIFSPNGAKIDPMTYNYTLWRYLPE